MTSSTIEPTSGAPTAPTGRRPAVDTSELVLGREPLARQLRWMIGIRLVVVTSVVLPYLLLQLSAATEAPSFDFLYLLAGVTYAVSLLYIALLRLLAGHWALQAYIQFLGDLLLITGLVYYFGGIASPFSILYLIVIIVASTLLRRRSGFTVATTAWLLHGAVVVGVYFLWIPLPQGESSLVSQAESIPLWRLAYNLSAHGFGFYAAALLASRLAQSVSRAERELREKREDLADLQIVHRDVIESIPSGLITCDLEGHVTSANQAAQEILGRPAGQLVGQPLIDSGLFDRRLWEELTSGKEVDERSRREVTYPRQGELRYIGYSVTTLTNAEGSPSGHIVIFQDLSDWRKLQEEVRLKERLAAVGELASGIAHEVGNPLAAISGSVQMLSSSLDGEPAQKKLLQIILHESQRLDRTVKGFLRFARPRDRASVRFDVARLLGENLELLRNSPEVTDRHQLRLDLEPASVSIIADPDQVSQIFWNLARNALRAMPDGGTLRVEGVLRGASYRVRFVDTGRGMSEEERRRLFHPFHSFFDGGSGIGMAIVYRIVEEHGGRITVDSLPGKGTSITVELPVGAGAAAGLEAREVEA